MEIKSARYLISNPAYEDCPKTNRPEFAFIGRSNVGKSSLINMLCNSSKLAKTSSAPGKTQLINHFEIISKNAENVSGSKKEQIWFIVDLPGYGYAKVAQKDRRRWEQMIEGYIRKRENLVCLFVLIDSRHEPLAIDIEIINKLGKWEIPFVLVFTKADKNKPGVAKKHANAFLQKLREEWEEMPPFFISSAQNKEGRIPLLDYIASLLKDSLKSY